MPLLWERIVGWGLLAFFFFLQNKHLNCFNLFSEWKTCIWKTLFAASSTQFKLLSFSRMELSILRMPRDMIKITGAANIHGELEESTTEYFCLICCLSGRWLALRTSTVELEKCISLFPGLHHPACHGSSLAVTVAQAGLCSQRGPHRRSKLWPRHHSLRELIGKKPSADHFANYLEWLLLSSPCFCTQNAFSWKYNLSVVWWHQAGSHPKGRDKQEAATPEMQCKSCEPESVEDKAC